MLKQYMQGLGFGMMLQLALGPVFFLLAKISLGSGLVPGLSAVLAVVLCDFTYLVLAILGLGALIKKIPQKLLASASALVLLIFAALYLMKAFNQFSLNLLSTQELSQNAQALVVSPLTAFKETLALTASSPLTIVFWAGVFGSKLSEEKLSASELFFFSFGCVSATALFLGASVLIFSLLLRSFIPKTSPYLDLLLGLILIGFALRTLIKTYRKPRIKTEDPGM